MIDTAIHLVGTKNRTNMSTSLALIAAKALPALSGSSISYNPEKNVYLTLGYTSAAGNTYYRAIRLSKRLAVYYHIGEGYARTFLNGITLFCWDGQKAIHVTPVETRTERIISYGPVRVIAEIEVTGWQYQGSELDMTTRYTLYAGHRDLRIEAFFDEPLKKEIFCTGVQDIVGNSKSFSDHKGLVGSWGTDWPVNDTVKYAKETVGLGTCIPQRYVKSEEKDKANFLYTITAPGSNYFRYHTTFTSMKETFGYKTPEAWFAYLRQWKEELAHPVTVKIKDICITK